MSCSRDLSLIIFLMKNNLNEDEEALVIAFRMGHIPTIEYLISKGVSVTEDMIIGGLISDNMEMWKFLDLRVFLPSVDMLNIMAGTGHIDMLNFWLKSRDLRPEWSGIFSGIERGYIYLLDFAIENNVELDLNILTCYVVKKFNVRILEVLVEFLGVNIYYKIIECLSKLISDYSWRIVSEYELYSAIHNTFDQINAWLTERFGFSIYDVINYSDTRVENLMLATRSLVIFNMPNAVFFLAKYNILPPFESTYQFYCENPEERKWSSQLFGDLFDKLFSADVKCKNLFTSPNITKQLYSEIEKYKKFIVNVPYFKDF